MTLKEESKILNNIEKYKGQGRSLKRVRKYKNCTRIDQECGEIYETIVFQLIFRRISDFIVHIKNLIFFLLVAF
jgi:hypothetical protein